MPVGSHGNLRTLVLRGLATEEVDADDDAIEAVVAACEGDARAALTTVEVAAALARAAATDPAARATGATEPTGRRTAPTAAEAAPAAARSPTESDGR